MGQLLSKFEFLYNQTTIQASEDKNEDQNTQEEDSEDERVAREGDDGITKILQNLNLEEKDVTWLEHGKFFYLHEKPINETPNVFYGKQVLPDHCRDVAVKFVKYSDQAERELDLLRKARHPNIIDIIHSGKAPSHAREIYIVMMLCTKNLQQYVEELGGKPLDMETFMSIFNQLLNGVGHLHEKKIIHRDVKPDNILLTESGGIKLSDFGIGKQIASGRAAITQTRYGAGSEGYCPPESYAKNTKLTTAVDIFSLALVVIHLISNGRHPFGSNPHNWGYNIRNNRDLDLSIIPQHIPPSKRDQLIDLAAAMLKSEPQERPSVKQIKSHNFFKDDDATVSTQEGDDDSETILQNVELGKKGDSDVKPRTKSCSEFSRISGSEGNSDVSLVQPKPIRKSRSSRSESEASLIGGNAGPVTITNSNITIVSGGNNVEGNIKNPVRTPSDRDLSEILPGPESKDITCLQVNKFYVFHKEPINKSPNVFYGIQILPDSHRDVAVKLIKFSDQANKEIHFLTKARHQNIVQIIDANELDFMGRWLYIVMELCAKNLRQYLKDRGGEPLDMETFMLIFNQLLNGLEYLHDIGVLHRDIKPDNILVTKNGTIKFSDFGISKQIALGRDEVTQTEYGAGSDGYRPPESYLINTKLTTAADIFPLALVVIYLISNGRHPFGSVPFDWRDNIRNNRDLDLSIIPHHIPPSKRAQLIDLVAAMLKSEPQERPSVKQIKSHDFFKGVQTGEAEACSVSSQKVLWTI